MLVKSLQKYGNSYAIIIDKAIMDATGFTPETELQLTVNGNSISIRPKNDGIDPVRFEEARKLIRTQFADTMKKLAE